MSRVRLELRVGGMHCSSCALLVDDVVEDLYGVERCETDARSGRCVVQCDDAVVSAGTITTTIEALGYQAAVAARGAGG